MPLKSITRFGAKQCDSHAHSTNRPCKNPAMKGSSRCRQHKPDSRPVSTLPNNYEAKIELHRKRLELSQLEDIMRHIGLITGLASRGRKPKGYQKLDLSDPKQMAEAIKMVKLKVRS